MTANKTFKKGSAVYTCRCCNRSTRDIHGEGDLKLCYQCYELAGYENELNDYGEVNKDAVNDFFNELLEKGVDAEKIKREFTSLWDYVTPVVLDLAPKARKTKYDYPEGMTKAEKKKFRAAQRRKS